MSELRSGASSLDEIKLEIDIIILDIESLGESERDDAVKYLVNSLEELKAANTWEKQNTIKNYKSENHDATVDMEEYPGNKRIKMESTVENNIKYKDMKMDHPEEPIDHTEEVTRQVGKEVNNDNLEQMEEFNPEGWKVDKQHGYLENEWNEEHTERDTGFSPAESDDGHAALVGGFYHNKEQVNEYVGEYDEQRNIMSEHAPGTKDINSEDTFENLAEELVIEGNYKEANDLNLTDRSVGYLEDLLVEREDQHQSSTKQVSTASLYNGKVPTCVECNTSFPSLGTLDMHVKSAHKAPKTANVNNLRSFRQNPEIRKNSSNDSPVIHADADGKFQCPYCDHRGSKRYDLKLHMNRHTGRYRCDACDVNLTRQLTLDKHNQSTEHLKKVNRNLLLLQQPTEQPPVASAPLQQCHQTNQTEPKSPEPEQGDVIEQLFSENVSVDGQNFSMDFLLGSSPQKTEEDLFNSPVEPQTVPVSQNALNNYIDQQLMKSRSAGATTFSSLPQKNFKCELCDNSYGKSDSLKRHMITHSGKFKCPTCEQGFTEKKRLDIHVKDIENCKKLLMKRGQIFESRKEQNEKPDEKDLNLKPMPFHSDQAFSGNVFQAQQNYFELPQGLQIRRKSQQSTPDHLADKLGFFQNQSLKQKLAINLDLSIEIKNEPSLV
eukprot:GFUD01020291.1.p1 GENE.GFUD01020291.1~~GFUD01020291.1.p1  ORF type:complete len:662 (-),score=162.01 GFUD01020291.1:18-2003(-)